MRSVARILGGLLGISRARGRRHLRSREVLRLEQKVRDLGAREEISDVILRLARATDRRDSALISSCYHEDGIDDHNRFVGAATEFSEWVPAELARMGFSATSHAVGPSEIVVDGARARAETQCLACHAGDGKFMVLGLRYLDEFEMRNGEWLIATRQCVFDWRLTETPSDGVTATFPPEYRAGRVDASDASYEFWRGSPDDK